MTSLELIVEELRTLTPERLKDAALYVNRLQQSRQEERWGMLPQTAGSITQEEADEWKKAIEDCERIDKSGW